MLRGLVPGLTAVYNLYSDGLHLNNAGSYLVALTFYATIFGKNPVGLPVGGYQAQPGNPAANVQITPAPAGVPGNRVGSGRQPSAHRRHGGRPVACRHAGAGPGGGGRTVCVRVVTGFWSAPHRWRLAHGSLPPGLAVTPTGRIEGRPTAAGTSTVRFAVTDTAGTEATAEFSLAVEAPVDPVIPPQPLPALAVGTVILQE